MSLMTMEMFFKIQSIVAAEVMFVRISTPILMVFGNIGEILNIIIFVQRTFRTNSCALYFLAAACARLFFINFAILFNNLAFGYNIDPASNSEVFCKIKLYLSTIAAILPPSFVVLACIDRFMLSSVNAKVRGWSQPRYAYRSIIGVTIFWIIFTIHSLIGAGIRKDRALSYCYIAEGSYTLFVALYSIIINYLLPPILMTILGLLTIINVRRTQRQTHPRPGVSGYTQRKDLHLLRMLLFQVLVNIIFTIPGAAYQIYRSITDSWPKDPVWQVWDIFYLAVGLALFYIPYCIGFYIYTLTASIFRQELKKIFVQSYRRIVHQSQTRVTTVTSVAT